MSTQINIEISWSVLLSVECTHEYFREGICPDLEFVPTENTALLLRNYQLVYRPKPGGFSVFYKNSVKALQALLRLPADLKLSFYLRVRDHRFWHYTQLPFVSENFALYFANTYPAPAKTSLKPLHSDTLSNKPDLVGIRPKRFMLETPTPLASKDITCTDFAGNTVEWCKNPAPENQPAAQHAFNLGGYPEGRYTIKIKGKPEIPIYTLDKFANTLGIIDLFGAPPLEANRFAQKNKIVRQDYHIRFQNRATYWKYYLLPLGKDELNFSDIQVLLQEEKINFSKPQKSEMPGNRTALVIESEQPIPLLEPYSDTEKLELKLKKGDKWLSRTAKVDKPGIDKIKPDRSSGKVYSTVYAYI